jgi:hypothetical protein
MNTPVSQTARPSTRAALLGGAFSITLPVFFGYIAIGIPFGLMLVNAGYPWWLSPIMSMLMYAGAGQYVAVGLFAARAPLPAMVLAMLMVNIRHIVYGLSLMERFKTVGRWNLCPTDRYNASPVRSPRPVLWNHRTAQSALLDNRQSHRGARRGDYSVFF